MELEVTQNQLGMLVNSCQNKPWWHSHAEEARRVVVYVHFMNHEVLTSIPPTVDRKQVVVHFESSQCKVPEKYFTSVNLNRSSSAKISNLEEEEITLSDYALFLIELEDLEEQCGHDTLESIFFEAHDGDDAVTNYSSAFPIVRKRIEKLYNKYGFDVIYEEF